MVDLPDSGKELCCRNVTIHSQGKTEHGTLRLLQHHACFSYYPGQRDNNSHDARARHSIEPRRSGNSTPVPSAADEEFAKQTPRASQKARAKDIWIPYPMISHCILRPSHAASTTVPSRTNDDISSTAQDSDELFPPTFGTASYSQGRLSTDSTGLIPSAAPSRPTTPRLGEIVGPSESARQPAIRIRRKDFQMLALHFSAPDDELARQVFYVLRRRCCIEKIEDLHAFHFQAHKSELKDVIEYDARREFARMGISAKAADGPGSAWRISDINHDYSYSPTYPSVLCVPKEVSDNLLKYGGPFRSKVRIPSLAYLHSNGGSITRCSQPMVGTFGKRNPQDEKLVKAIFASHTPPVQSLERAPADLVPSPSLADLETSSSQAPATDTDASSLPTSKSETSLDNAEAQQPVPRKVYGSTRRNLIIDARPKLNAQINKGKGGGVEDVSNYSNGDMPVETVFLNVANIHVMRSSLDKVIKSLGSADYLDMKPNQEALRKSGWLGHIAGLLDGTEMVARVVGLGGSHVLVHCSDGWDRTAQVSALAQIMLDPHYRTLTGFISLVQKDFISYGHKFQHRNGIEGSEKWFEIENERIEPFRHGDTTSQETGTLNGMGTRALTGARNWLERNRGNFFTQQNNARDTATEQPGSRPASPPPPNPLIHSTPTADKDEKDHRMDEKEVSPVFHQFLDTVYQLLYQAPDAFEFNERFLKRLFYHTYACQYGEFLFNTEKERSKRNLPSVWGHFLSRRPEFTNPDYKARTDDPLLFPRRQGLDREVEVRWWAGLFGRKEEDMNLPRSLATESLTASASLGSSISPEDQATIEGEKSGVVTPDVALRANKSTPSLSSTVRHSLSGSFSALRLRDATSEVRKESAPEVMLSQPPPIAATNGASAAAALDSAEEAGATVAGPVVPEAPTSEPNSETPLKATQSAEPTINEPDQGDPLGVSSEVPQAPSRAGRGLDFAAFASQNAFRER